LARNWNSQYADPDYAGPPPDPLLIEVADGLAPGHALDLACGAGRHAIYLSQLGWRVVAVDASAAGIARLRKAAPGVDARVADLEEGQYIIPPAEFDLVCDFYYLQRDLFPAIRQSVRPGGTFVGALHLTGSFALQSGELRNEFAGWKILYYSEGAEAGRSRASARIVARKA
jgi:SAM-dependent methyltransferase